ncbi:hypothetical protein IV203_031211 [Nitzschia inconspicua]|uniref:Uncharacterized protein n=1 Tax=Nitzschia inconspicua TaxID=303405 RepID=A0A9K3LTX7_9STRA|nr:hypothetical protein IV203_031211 [Nitzschia inconspicua]
MPSAVRNRIASYEAQSGQNHHNHHHGTASNHEPDAASHGTSRSRKSVANIVASTTQQRAGSSAYPLAGSSGSREPPGVSPLWSKKKTTDANINSFPTTTTTTTTSTSITVAASQNRKSRLKQSHQGSGIGSISSSNSSSNNLVGQQPQPPTNLLEKRKLIKERRLMQKQRRAAVPSTTDDHDEGIEAASEQNTEVMASRSVTPPSGVDQRGNKMSSSNDNNNNDNVSRVPDSPGRFAKFQRMTARKKGYEKGTQLRYSAQQPHQQSSSAAAASGDNVTTGSSAATSLVRNTATNRGSSKTSQTEQQQNHSPSHTTSTRSSVRRGRSDPVGQMSLDNQTDDDATMTSVRRIMDPQNKHHNSPQNRTQGSRNIHGSYDSVSSSNGGVSPSSWRPLSSNKATGTTRYQALSNIPTAIAGLYNNSRATNGNASGPGGIWMEEEKSNKIHASNIATNTTATGPRVLRTASSSDYDTDGDISKTSRQSAQRLLDGPSHSQATDVNDFFDRARFAQPNQNQRNNENNNNNSSSSSNNHLNNTIQNLHRSNIYHNTSSSINSSAGPRRIDDDERTFDYGDRDDDSNESTSYAMRRRKEAERRALLGADNHNSTKSQNEETPLSDPEKPDIGDGLPQLLSKEDMEKYTKTMENPAMKLGAGVVGVATVGCIAFGAVGLLVGVAAAGLGYGVMQIPEEERNKIHAKAEKTIHDLKEKAIEASEKVSSNCITTYKDSGVADHLPHCLSGADGDDKDIDSTRSENLCNAGGIVEATSAAKRSHKNPHTNQASDVNAGPQVEQLPTAQTKPHHNDRLRNKKVACLRNVRIMPASQIHGLEPSAQPRAWLDIVASANTSNGQKNEAMEEILLLAKDKRRAKIFLDEGILDSIIWTLSRYFEKLEVVGKESNWAFPDISRDEKVAASLAAQCCVTLGKAHCAAIHTEGDLQLMSMYERGTVPEERQVAQMLHEVPHHTRITKTDDPTIVEPNKEVFALRQLTLPQAEELAKSIKAVADGKL